MSSGWTYSGGRTVAYMYGWITDGIHSWESRTGESSQEQYGSGSPGSTQQSAAKGRRRWLEKQTKLEQTGVESTRRSWRHALPHPRVEPQVPSKRAKSGRESSADCFFVLSDVS